MLATQTISLNLLPRYDALAATRRFYISPGDADVTVTRDYKISDADLWQILTSPIMLSAVMKNAVKWSAVKRPGGRTMIGAANHCAHGKGSLQYTYLDWHPFAYFTALGVEGATKFYETYEIEPLPNNAGSRLTLRWRLDTGLPRWVVKLVASNARAKMGIGFLQMIEDYIAGVQNPTFQ